MANVEVNRTTPPGVVVATLAVLVMVSDETVTVVVQINGKVRDRLQVNADATEDEVRGMALKSDAVIRNLDGKAPKKVIYVPHKLVSIVA